MSNYLIGTDPTLRKTKTPTVTALAAGVGFTAGTSTAITLGADPGSEEHVIVTMDGVTQHRSTYSVSGTTLTFDAAIPTGTAQIEATFGVPVSSVTVPDNSVTLAKLAGGTDGNIISFDSSGDPVAIATGTSGHFLKSQGAGAQPVFAADNKGGLTFISNTDISNAATYDFESFTAASYEHYLFILQNLIPATDDQHFHALISTDGGSSYDTGSSQYDWGGRSLSGNLTLAGDQSSSEEQFSLTGDQTTSQRRIGSDTNESGVSGQIWLYGPHTTSYTHFLSHIIAQGADGGFASAEIGGARLTGADVDGFRLKFASGNIESGTVTVFGIANS